MHKQDLIEQQKTSYCYVSSIYDRTQNMIHIGVIIIFQTIKMRHKHWTQSHHDVNLMMIKLGIGTKYESITFVASETDAS